MSTLSKAIEVVIDLYGSIAEKLDSIDLHDEVDKIKLWALDLGFLHEALGKVLERSSELRSTAVANLRSFASLLKEGLIDLELIQNGHQRLQLLEKHIRDIAHQIPSENSELLADQGNQQENSLQYRTEVSAAVATNERAFYISKQDSERFIARFANIGADFRSLGVVLIDSIESLEDEADEHEPPTKELSLEVQPYEEMQQDFEMTLFRKYPNGDQTLLKRFAKLLSVLCTEADHRTKPTEGPPGEELSYAGTQEKEFAKSEEKSSEGTLVNRQEYLHAIYPKWLEAIMYKPDLRKMFIESGIIDLSEPRASDVPRPPVELASGVSFTDTLQEGAILDDESRRKHALSDLWPYLCTFESCTNKMARFSTREDWIRHQNTHVNRAAHTTYICTIRGCEAECTTPESFDRHFLGKHKELWSDPDGESDTTITEPGEIASFFASEKETRNELPPACPFCGSDKEHLQSDFLSHISHHMEDIAFGALNSALTENRSNLKFSPKERTKISQRHPNPSSVKAYKHRVLDNFLQGYKTWSRYNFPFPSQGPFHDALSSLNEHGIIKCPGCATLTYDQAKYKKCIAKHLRPYVCVLCEEGRVHTISRFPRIDDCISHIRHHHFKDKGRRPQEDLHYRIFTQDEVDQAAERYLEQLGPQTSSDIPTGHTGIGEEDYELRREPRADSYDEEYNPSFDSPLYGLGVLSSLDMNTYLPNSLSNPFVGPEHESWKLLFGDIVMPTTTKEEDLGTQPEEIVQKSEISTQERADEIKREEKRSRYPDSSSTRPPFPG